MLAPPGATVVVVVLFVAAPPASTAGLPVVVVFCDKQADCGSAVVVTFVPPAAGPNDAPLGARVAAVSLPLPVACTGPVGTAAIDVSNIKTVGKARVVMNLPYTLG
jgi:hypothetical protein